MKKFTKEQWTKIGEARIRLEAYKNRIQPYRAYPDETITKPQVTETVVRHITYNAELTKRQWDTINSLRNEVRELRKRVSEIW